MSDPSIHQQLVATVPADSDPQESAEWRDAFRAVLQATGPARARELMDMLSSMARDPSVAWQPVRGTPYVNTIPVAQQPAFPGDLAIEERLASLMRWNALAMVVRANQAHGELGGHIASYASAADLFEVGFNHFFRARHAGRTLEVTVAAGLPEVEADAALLRRLLGNLLDNAAKYSDAGTPVTLAARAGGPEAGGGVALEVTDGGIGIAEEDLPRLFTPFFRTDRSRARGTGGVGLGLALAKRIAEAHGGTIGAGSAPGAGTTFRVTLPPAA